jgi:hypothetical protein
MTDCSFVRRTAAVALFTVASSLALHAQQATGNSVDSGASSTSAVSFATPVLAFHLTIDDSSSSSVPSSSSDNTAVSSSSVPALDFSASGLQPPPRRSYGRPRYNDSSHNADGSNKYTFEGAIGYAQPLGNTYHYLTPSYAFRVGGGRNFNKKVAVIAQFDWDNFGFNGRTLTNQAIVEDPTNSYGIQGSLDGTSHLWSFTLNPRYTILDGDKLGAYVVAGGGFYHKTANFFVTVPVQGYYYGYPITYAANETIDKYTSNAGGVNGGFGITYKPSRFANERLFAEVRYDLILNQQRKGFNITNYGQETATSTNLYPANSNRTTYIPLKVGIRF